MSTGATTAGRCYVVNNGMRCSTMLAAITLFGTLAFLAAAGPAAQAQRAAHAPPLAPTLVEPADDPRHEKCFMPDADQGIKFVWRLNGPGPGGEDYPVASYINIERWEGSAAGWRPWVKKYAGPPFTLNVRPNVYDASFAWRVWAVDRSGTAEPYATPSEWRMFCTLPAGELPSGSSRRPG